VEHKERKVEKAHEIEVQYSHQQQDNCADYSIESCPKTVIAVNGAFRRRLLVA
jgi:hypothetical protein